jgi:probable addiction module antidote protein
VTKVRNSATSRVRKKWRRRLNDISPGAGRDKGHGGPVMRTTRFDAAEYLGEPEDQVALLDEALATGDARVIVHAIGTIARARGMTELSRTSGIARSSLYKAVADDANPTIETVMKLLSSLRIGLSAQTKTAA